MKQSLLHDTICAPATPPGHSALAVVRVSGDDAFAIAAHLSHKPLKINHKHGLVVRTLCDSNDEVIDKSVITYFRNPHSYTGQDVVEFSIHGSPAILEKLMTAILATKVRLAEPGEFTLRAFWNGKLTLDQAEGVAALIAAEDDSSRKSALRLLDGAVGSMIQTIQSEVIRVAAKLELELDFSEEELPIFPLDTIRSEIEVIRSNCRKLVQTALATQSGVEGIRIALAGPTNAGKSSLLNQLLARDKAIVSAIPGTTRDVVEGELRLLGRKVKLFDTAGIRVSEDEIEQEGVRRSKVMHQNADMVLWLHPVDLPLSELTLAPDFNGWIILNKVDLMTKSELAKLVKSFKKQFPFVPVVLLSAKSGEGVGTLRKLLEDWIRDQQTQDASQQTVPLNARHGKVLKQAIGSLGKAIRLCKENGAPEIIAEELKQANEYISEISGVGVSEAVLSKIFSGFCIGK